MDGRGPNAARKKREGSGAGIDDREVGSSLGSWNLSRWMEGLPANFAVETGTGVSSVAGSLGIVQLARVFDNARRSMLAKKRRLLCMPFLPLPTINHSRIAAIRFGGWKSGFVTSLRGIDRSKQRHVRKR